MDETPPTEPQTSLLGLSSAESEDLTTGSPEPDSATPSSANPTPTAETCSEPGSPESPSTMTFVKSQWAHDPEDCERWEETDMAPTVDAAGHGPRTATLVLTSSAEDPPAKTSPSPDNDAASPATGPDCSSSSPESLTLFDLDGFSSRTYPGSSVATAVGTSESCLERWPTSGTAWDGGFSTAVSSECRSGAEGCSSSERSLSEILEPPQNVPAKYLLSARAARGILRRAEKRGRMLPGHLAAALESVAGLRTPSG